MSLLIRNANVASHFEPRCYNLLIINSLLSLIQHRRLVTSMQQWRKDERWWWQIVTVRGPNCDSRFIGRDSNVTDFFIILHWCTIAIQKWIQEVIGQEPARSQIFLSISFPMFPISNFPYLLTSLSEIVNRIFGRYNICHLREAAVFRPV